MYALTLTGPERKAIDWVGNRYDHGDKLRDLLEASETLNTHDPDEEAPEWSSNADITYNIPEHIAWQIKEIVDESQLECFGDTFIRKLWDFCAMIV